MYKLTIPADIAMLFLSIMKKNRVLCEFIVTHRDVHVVSDDGVVGYEHGIKIHEPCSFVFPIDPSIKMDSDMDIEWDVETDANDAIHVKNAKFTFAGHVLQVPSAGWSTVKAIDYTECKSLPPALTSALPTLSKYATDGRRGISVIFPGVVFTNQSVFATTGTVAACWGDAVHDTNATTSSIVAAFREIIGRYNEENTAVFTQLYNYCVTTPEDYWETLDFLFDDFMYRSAEEWLHIFKNQFPTAESFCETLGNTVSDAIDVLPVSFPSYLDKLLVQDECTYGFAMRYLEYCLHEACKIKTPSDMLFCITAQTYGGKKLQGKLVWYTPISISFARMVKALDKKLYATLAAMDKTLFCHIPTAVFQTLQKKARVTKKLVPTDVPNVAFINHGGKLGIGSVLQGEIASTATTLSCPKGIEKYVIIPAEFAKITIPFNVTTVTMAFKEDDVTVPVYVIAGNILYCFGRIDRYEGQERVAYSVTYQDSVIVTPPQSKFGIVSAPLVLAKRS